MNKSIGMALAAVALVVMVGGLGLIALTGAAISTDRYPSVQQDITDQVDLGFLASGILRETGAYRTNNDPLTVAAWYQFRDQLQPTRSSQPTDACLRLEKENDYPVVRLTTVVSLCPSGQGAAVSFSRQLTLGH